MSQPVELADCCEFGCGVLLPLQGGVDVESGDCSGVAVHDVRGLDRLGVEVDALVS